MSDLLRKTNPDISHRKFIIAQSPQVNEKQSQSNALKAQFSIGSSKNDSFMLLFMNKGC